MAAIMETTENKISIAAELLRLMQGVDYCRTIKPLKLTEAVMIVDFGMMELATLFELDTSKCFTGKKKLKFNKYCIYDIFASNCGLDRFVLKDMVNKEIKDNLIWYTKVSNMCLGWKDTDITAWLKKQAYKCTAPDKLCLYALSVIFCRHTIAYTTFQPWCIVDMKPGLTSQKVLEACETKLIYLGDNLFGELHCKPVGHLQSPLINIDELHAARQLYREPNFKEMYIEHTSSSDFNISNTQIIWSDDHYILPTDVTRILPSNPTVFDSDYIPETKIEPPDDGNISSFALTESLGSNLGEIVFPAPVKQEPLEILRTIISSHSPTCQLWIKITDTYTVKNNSGTNMAPDLDWSLDVNASTSSNTMDDSQKSSITNYQDGPVMMPTGVFNSSQDATEVT